MVDLKRISGNLRQAFLGAPVLLLASGCSSSLPEAGSPDAVLYVKECGGCHAAIPPRTLRPAMWEFQMKRMDEIRREQGWPPISVSDRERVMAYLARNAG